MLRAAIILAATLALPGIAVLAATQEATDEQFMPVGDSNHWFLQRSTCTIAHSLNGDSPAVVRFRIGMGTEIEFVDPALRNVRQGASAEFDVGVDGASEWTLGMGIEEEGRRGYRLGASHEMLDRIAAGRRLEARTGGRTLLRLDLAGAAPAIAAMRACYDEGAVDLTNAMAEDSNLTNAQ